MDLLTIAADVASQYRKVAQVKAMAIGGSLASGAADNSSDIDLYAYTSSEIPMNVRTEIAMSRSDQCEIGNHFWEPGDEWIERQTGVLVDVMFRSTSWIEEQLHRVLGRYEASIGYSTCLWHNVLHSRLLFDTDGWFVSLQEIARRPYPEPLRRAIVKKNHPILRDKHSSYYHQLKKAIERHDPVSVNHRLSVFLASYFDVVFAVNRLPHPGEKRLLRSVSEMCSRTPSGMESQIESLIGSISDDTGFLDQVNGLVDALDDLLAQEGLLER